MIEIYGVESSRSELDGYLRHGARLTNYSPGKIDLFGVHHCSGCIGQVYGQLADELGKKHDSWNFGVWERRLRGDKDVCGRTPKSDEERQANIAYWTKDLGQ